MVNQSLEQQPQRNFTTYESEHGEVRLDVKVVQEFFCKDATPAEAFTFIQAAKSLKLNPWLKEIYLIRYQRGQPASVVLGRDAHMLALEREPQADGMESGIVVMNSLDAEVYRDGSRLRKGDVLIGGWAKVYRKDRRVPVTEDVPLDEWDKGQAFWKKSPGYMIQKVAEVHALKKAFPGFLKKDIQQDLEIEGITVDSIDPTLMAPPVLEGEMSEIEDPPEGHPEVIEPEDNDDAAALGLGEKEENW